MSNSNIFLITGLSGAGKTFLLKALEDEGYYTVDNVPPHLIKAFLNVICTSEINKIAIVSDIRWKNTDELVNSFIEVNSGFPCDIILKKVFLDADDITLENRFKKSRRSHPLKMELKESIEKERKLLQPIKEICDIVIDTSNTEPGEFRKKFFQIINEEKRQVKLNVMSFGYKYSIPQNSDYIFDVRFLPNPFYFYEMYKDTGLDSSVKSYLESFTETHEIIKKLYDLACFVQDNYTNAGRIEATFSVGCTGGKHRSVYVAQQIYKMLKNNGRDVEIQHRDLGKE